MSGTSYHAQVAATLIEQLARGTAPWVKPWKPGERFMPYNPVTGRTYRGMNAVWLLATATARGYGDARWLTFAQATTAGGQLQKGAKGTVIQYWKWREETPVRDPEGKPLTDAEGRPLVTSIALERPRVFSAVVFNAGQIAGLPPAPERATFPEWERHELAEAIAAKSGVTITHIHGDRASYSVHFDRITLPERGQFATADGYYATKLHELGHASGHPSRLARDLGHPFGSEGYAREELRAEIASLMLGERLCIGHNTEHHAAYVEHWIKILSDDPRELFRAAADAEKITTFLCALEPRLAETPLQEKIVTENAVRRGSVAVPKAEKPRRTYLTVPYADKDEAKALGARWDKAAKSWFVPRKLDPAPFARWRAPNVVAPAPANPVDEFAAAILSAGLQLDGAPLMDSRLHRVPVEGDKRGRRSGAYVGHLEGSCPAGYIQNFKTGLAHNWKAQSGAEALSAVDKSRLYEESRARQAERERRLQAIHTETMRLIEAHLVDSPPPPADHPYLAAKGVGGHGLFLDVAGPLRLLAGGDSPHHWSARGNLLVPICDIDGQLLSAQSIDAEGNKTFPRGARWLGGMHVIGTIEGGQAPIVVVEGYATGATLHEATGLTVAVAFNAGNLESVARSLRDAHPDALLIIAGDNDHQKARELMPDGQPKPNTGRMAAEKAAAAVGGFALLPVFAADDPGSDWNDLVAAKGRQAFAEQWQTGLATIQRQVASEAIGAERQHLAEAPQADIQVAQEAAQAAHR